MTKKSWISDKWKHMIRSDKLSFALFTTLGRLFIWRTPKEAYNPKYLVPTVNYEEGTVMVWAEILYSVGPLHGHITAKEYVDRFGNRAHPMGQTLCSDNDAVFKDDNAPNHTAGTVQSWFDEHEGELQHLP
jgi:hypothetical protein